MNFITKLAYKQVLMDISAQIEALQKEHDELAVHEKDIHKRMVGLRTRIGKLKTVIRHAEEVLNPESAADVLKDVSDNLK